MSDPLYKRALLRLAADGHGAGALPEPCSHGTARNPTCGDCVEFDVTMTAGRIVALAQRSKACVLTQASASILGEAAAGHNAEEIAALRDTVARMLAEDAAPPGAPFEGFKEFKGAASIPGRHICVLLPIDALLKAMG